MLAQPPIILPEDLLEVIDQEIGQTKKGTLPTRTEIIESILRHYFFQKREKKESNDLEIINLNSDFLNQEANDILSYQVDL